MATASLSKLPLVSDHIESAQNYRSPDAPRQPSSCRAGSPNSLRGPLSGESITRIPSPTRSNRRYSSVFSSKPPSRSSSPVSSLASSVNKVNANDEKAKEPEPDLPKAPEHFSRAFSVPKALFQVYEDNREWHFGFAPTQDVHVLLMLLNEETSQRQKAEQQVRDLTQRLSSSAEAESKIHLSEREQNGPEAEKAAAFKRLLSKERDERRRELIENKENKPLEERFEALVDWSDQVQEDYLAAQDRNTLFFDDLGKASERISKLKAKKKVLKADKAGLEKKLEQSRNQGASGRDSFPQTDGTKCEGAARQTTMAYDDQSSMALSAEPPKPPASRIDQENRLAELELENERLRQGNDEMRNVLDQTQTENGPPEGPESQFIEAHPEEAQIRGADPEVEVQGADVEMGGITTGQDSTAPQDTETPAMPVTAPVTSETKVIVGFDPQRHLNSINRDSRTNSDDARRRRDRRRREQRRRPERRRLEREEEAQQPRRHRNRSHEVYTQKKKTLWPLRWVRYRRRALMDFFSFGYMFSHRLSYRSR